MEERREWNIEDGDSLLLMALIVVDPSPSTFQLSRASTVLLSPPFFTRILALICRFRIACLFPLKKCLSI